MLVTLELARGEYVERRAVRAGEPDLVTEVPAPVWLDVDQLHAEAAKIATATTNRSRINGVVRRTARRTMATSAKLAATCGPCAKSGALIAASWPACR